ncbi:MAG TPA: phosphate/phosphite/phosphonate ABC transporter substrate-binding protein [Candidatus Methanoperedens sp.]|nr:phosphate/phosphite/phosphonate ABC transporter substrate-binding protein [Candidatus Methanoperedens sp.]HLB69583.1 phosphate/phosphite/phosphonate ABC transporter substrate-binding protein [Candidatus Methanoperedens sp.]
MNDLPIIELDGMKSIFISLILILLILTSGCAEKKEKVNLSIVQEQDIRVNDTAIKVAIASVVSPKESHVYYEEMIRYISKELGGPVKIIQRRSYKEVNDLVKNHEIDLAFVCSGAYIEGRSDFGMKLLVAPQLYGKTTYNSYIIVPVNSTYNSMLELRGRRFAFSDPLSNSGKLYPTYRLSLMNETPESFFGKDEKGRDNYFFTYSHDSSIIAVAEQLAEGAAVDSLVFEYMKETKPEIISKVRVIETSPDFGIPPVVVPEDIDPFLEQRLKNIFLKMNKDDEGRRILSRIRIERFVEINDSAYDSVREMRNKIR